MRFLYLAPLQKLQIGIVTLFFLILIGFMRPLLLGDELDTHNIIFLTVLFLLWYSLTIIFTNMVMYEYTYRKLNNFKM